MNAKVALNLTGLDNRAKLAKFQTGITKCGEAPALVTPTPPLTDCQAAHDAAEDMLELIDTKEQELVNLRLQRDQFMKTAMSLYGLLGSCVENKSLGNPAFITAKGFDVAGTGTPLPPVAQILSLFLTHSDHDGATDASWHRDKSAYSYEVQTSADPMSETSWTTYKIAPLSCCTIEGKPVGSKLWVRVRAIGTDNPGLWSDPACIIVT